MVGDPKTLSDLTRIEADVRVRCRDCGLEEDWSVESLRRHLAGVGGSEVWSELTRGMRCRRLTCQGTDFRVTPVPFSRKPPNMPRKVKALDGLLIDLALRILHAAAQRSTREPVGTPEVRLSLYVLRPYLRDDHLVRGAWGCACSKERAVITSLHQYVRWFEFRLRQRGWLLAEAELRRPTMPGNDR